METFHCLFFEQAATASNGTTDAACFGADLRRLQSKVNCTNKTLLEIIDLFSKHAGLKNLPKNLKEADKKLQQAAGFSFLRLHGCNKCGVHVYEPRGGHA